MYHSEKNKPKVMKMGGKPVVKMPGGGMMKKMPGGGMMKKKDMPMFMYGGKIFAQGGTMLEAMSKIPKYKKQMAELSKDS
tara:strand:+ start:2346 stop:2585 length:240 start_codon:yes stop_codon:yes gene_type:complete